MSIEATSWALCHAQVGDAVAKLVLWGIANHADRFGRNAYPSQATLAEYAEVSERTVRTKLLFLEERGLIRRGDQRHVDHIPANRRPVVWDLGYTQPREEESSPQAVTHDTPRPENPSPQEDARGEAPRHSGGKTASDKPSLEPINSSREELSPGRAREPDDRDTPQGDLGGRRPDTDTRIHRDRCHAHQLDPVPPPCRACKEARETVEHERAEAIRAAARAEHEQAELDRAATFAAIRHCRLCDDHGYTPHGGICRHNPAQPAITAAGAAAARAAYRAAQEDQPCPEPSPPAPAAPSPNSPASNPDATATATNPGPHPPPDGS